MCVQRDRKLSPLPSLLPTPSSLLSLFLSFSFSPSPSLHPLSLARARGGRRRWTFTRQRSAFRCAAMIAYCERENCRWDNPFERPPDRSRTIKPAKFGEKVSARYGYLTRRVSVCGKSRCALLRRVTQRTARIPSCSIGLIGSRRITFLLLPLFLSRPPSWLKYARACTPACPSLRNARLVA